MIKGFVELPKQVYHNGSYYSCPLLFSLDDIARVTECVDDYNYTSIVTKDGKVHTISLRYSSVVGKITDALEKRVQDDGSDPEPPRRKASERLLEETKKLKGEKTMDSNKYYIIRADRAGVFFGHIKERDGSEVTMTDVRRLWYWEGAASLSQMAVDGTNNPQRCKFTVTVPEMTILGVIEIIPCSDKAASSILGVKEWRA